MPRLKKGYVHVYTGSGKGKTTAALGLALRAAGAGLKVFIAQFAKGIATGELKAMERLARRITVRQFGTRSFIRRTPSKTDLVLAANGLATVEKIIAGGRYDLVILDEICLACHHNLLPTPKVLEIIARRPAYTEVVLTGRKAPKAIIDAADLVTEMKEIKHYFSAGVKARKGIEY